MKNKFTRPTFLTLFKGAMFVYLKTAIQKGLVLAILLIGVNSALWAQACEGDVIDTPATFDAGVVAADGSSGTGGLAFADGSAATWTITNSTTAPLQGFNSGLSANNELWFWYDGPNNFDLTTTFDIAGIPAGKVVKLRLYGNLDGTGYGNTSFGSKFSMYTISWTGGGSAPAVVVDPAGQIVGGGQPIANGGSFTQVFNPASPTGAIPNDDLEWYVDFPAGATSFTITALAGRDKEGFRFSAVECECIDCDSFEDDGAALCTYLADYMTDNGVASALATLDCDGGGVDNTTECDEGKDPFEPSDDICEPDCGTFPANPAGSN